MNKNSMEPRQLVPSYAHCKLLNAREWDTSYVWLGEDQLVSNSELGEDGIGGPVEPCPAPTAEELLKAFYKLPLVKAPEIHFAPQFSMWQVWWENAKTHYMEHAEPAVKLADAAFNAYMQAKGEK